MEADLISLTGQAEIWNYMFSFADSMALKCAVELRIPDIINDSPGNGPISLSQIVAGISGDSTPDTSVLGRIMRLLVRRNIFSATVESDPILYGLTPSSKWLLQDTLTGQPSLAPMVRLITHDWMVAPWGRLSHCVMEGGSGFGRAHGAEIYNFASKNGEFGALFDRGMGCTAKTVIGTLVEGYGSDGFRGIGSVVDVGGGTGDVLAEIVRANPHVNGINFDLPHVVASAPEFPGVTHFGGDMFESVPKADAVFMKWIMHNWNDDDCLKILKNCRKAIKSESTGKLIIVDIVLEEKGSDDDKLFGDATIIFDLAMIAQTVSGKERTETEWKNLLKNGGFCLNKIIKIQALWSIIEAYPQ